jgi:hypothetical protein
MNAISDGERQCALRNGAVKFQQLKQLFCWKPNSITAVIVTLGALFVTLDAVPLSCAAGVTCLKRQDELLLAVVFAACSCSVLFSGLWHQAIVACCTTGVACTIHGTRT